MLAFISTLLTFSYVWSLSTASKTFAVCAVEPIDVNHTLINSITPEDLKRWMIKNETLSLENFQLNYPLAEALNGRNHRIANAFVATVFEAYSRHYPLEISVEDVWVTIAQSISIHLNENAEQYRHLMVSHEGKKTLKLIVDDLLLPPSMRPTHENQSLPVVDWPKAVHQMTRLIKDDMKLDLTSLLTTPFSNTTSIEQVVFDCTLMDSVKNYYDFRFGITCGIPQVTLRGSPDDFQDVINRLNRLKEIFNDFHWWFDSLIPHIGKLKASAEGHPDVEWWQKICHPIGGGSDITMLAGWLADFIPYAHDGQGHYRKARVDHHHLSQGVINGIDFQDFSESVTQTDFILDNNGDETKMKLIAGFLGISQNPTTRALRPALGWITAALLSE